MVVWLVILLAVSGLCFVLSGGAVVMGWGMRDDMAMLFGALAALGSLGWFLLSLCLIFK